MSRENPKLKVLNGTLNFHDIQDSQPHLGRGGLSQDGNFFDFKNSPRNNRGMIKRKSWSNRKLSKKGGPDSIPGDSPTGGSQFATRDANSNLDIISDNSVAWKQGFVTTLIALFYTALIVVSILVSVYSVHSIYKASTTAVTSTEIIEIVTPVDPPVLFIFDQTLQNNCSCSYYNYSESSQAVPCTTYNLMSTNHRYLMIQNPQVYEKYKDIINVTDVRFYFFQGPRFWMKQETLEVECVVPLDVNVEDSGTLEYLFLPDWQAFMNIDESERDVEIYSYLKRHPGMRFFPYGFDNFVLLSRTEIRDEENPEKTTIRLGTETSLCLIDKAGFIGQSGTNSSKVKVEVQWKDGYVTYVTSFISATIWSAVSVVSTMLLMLEKAYGFAARIYASVKSEREKKKILKQNKQRVINTTFPNPNAPTSFAPQQEEHDDVRNGSGWKKVSSTLRWGTWNRRSSNRSSSRRRDLPCYEEDPLNAYCNKYTVANTDLMEPIPISNAQERKKSIRDSEVSPPCGVSTFDVMRIERNLNEINYILHAYNLKLQKRTDTETKPEVHFQNQNLKGVRIEARSPDHTTGRQFSGGNEEHRQRIYSDT